LVEKDRNEETWNTTVQEVKLKKIRTWTGLIRLRTGSSCGFLWRQNDNLDTIQRGEFPSSWVTICFLRKNFFHGILCVFR